MGNETQADAQQVLRELEQEMWEASEKLEYERAALLRDQIEEWKRTHGLENSGATSRKSSLRTVASQRLKWGRKIRA